MADRRDEVLDRAVEVLRELPASNPHAVARIASAAAQARLDDIGLPDDDALPARRRVFRLRAVAGIAAAAAIVGFVARDIVVRQQASEPATPVSMISPSGTPAGQGDAFRTVSADPTSSATAPVPTQFVLENGDAATVSVVGDFNGWDADHTRLTREPGSTLWSVTLPVAPGRHVYAFIVNDSVWTPDPRAPRAQDHDFGVPGSILIVGRP